MPQLDITTPRPKTTKVKTDRYWFRVNGEEKTFIHDHMKEDDVANYFRECHAKLFKTLKRREDAKKKRKKRQTSQKVKKK